MSRAAARADYAPPHVRIGHDAAGRRSSLGQGVGAVAASAAYGYDAVGRLVGLTHDLAGAGADQSLGFAYNPASQITSRTSGNDAYASNTAYDVERAYAVNGLNQYTQAGTSAFAYDANGNLVSDGATTYTYDVENRLVSAAGARNVSLAYDPLGRLWQTSGPAGTTRFLYDGDRLALESDGAGNVLRSYVHGDGADEPLVWYEVPGGVQRRYLKADHQGSIVAVTDGNGNAVAINAYDAWGIPNAGNVGRFGYTGQAWIPELGMYYYKARIYSPILGRFMQVDPVGYDDQINLYAYVGNDPVNGTDPTGEEKCERTDGSVCGFARDFLVGDIEDAIANPSATSIAIAAVTTVFKPAKVLDKAVDSVQALRKVEKAADKLSPLKPSTPIGTRVRTPDNSPGNFTRLKGGQGFKDNKTGTVFQRSNTNHSQSPNGEFKAGPKPGEPPSKGNKDTVTGGQDGGCLLKRDRC